MSNRIKDSEPFYPVSMAAKLIGITADRLRTYEEEGLIKPHRTEVKSSKAKGQKRLYSMDDINWVIKLREIKNAGISISALKIILNLLPCWEKCSFEEIENLKNSEIFDKVKGLVESPVYKERNF